MRKTRATLALQGGGSHGAFTWGVLDKLLEDGRLEIEAVSGASAGAMNAVVLAYGTMLGGRDGARQALKDFWSAVSANAPLNFVPIDWTGSNELQVKPTPAFSAYLSMVRFFAPYQLNPFDLNPLRNILLAQVDFDRLRSQCKLELFVAATRVSTGTLRLFRTRELTLEALLASACLPALHSTVMIDGEATGTAVDGEPPFILCCTTARRATSSRCCCIRVAGRRRRQPSTRFHSGSPRSVSARRFSANCRALHWRSEKHDVRCSPGARLSGGCAGSICTSSTRPS
jgi:hypothetical protein